jgi:hypothetical protein
VFQLPGDVKVALEAAADLLRGNLPDRGISVKRKLDDWPSAVRVEQAVHQGSL